MGGSILSEFGTLHMEFSYLSDVTGQSVFREKVDRVRQVLTERGTPGGLFPNYLHPVTGDWGQREYPLSYVHTTTCTRSPATGDSVSTR